jgi:chromate reductase
MKLIAFAASTNSRSINKQLVTYATRLLVSDAIDGVADVSVETIDLNDFEMSIYSEDREAANGVPQQGHDFFAAIGAADAALISFAEHNGFYTAAYKNIFDWASRINQRVYQGTPAVLLSTSVGGRGGQNVLQTATMSGQFFGYEVLSSLSIPSFHDNFDVVAGRLSNPDLDTQLRTSLQALGTVVAAGSTEA